MLAADQPSEPLHLLKRCGWWLIGSLLSVFVVSFTLDVGVILALPVIAIVSLAAWVALLVRATRLSMQEGTTFLQRLVLAGGPVAAAAVAFLLFVPMLWIGAYVQAQAVLAWNAADYRREIVLHPTAGEPRMWLYGGWLSIDRAIVYSGNARSAKELESELDGYADCRWLRNTFYDCTISY